MYVQFYFPGDHPLFAEHDESFLNRVRRYLKKINSVLTDGDFVDMCTSRYRYAQPICDLGYLEKLPPVVITCAGPMGS